MLSGVDWGCRGVDRMKVKAMCRISQGKLGVKASLDALTLQNMLSLEEKNIVFFSLTYAEKSRVKAVKGSKNAGYDGIYDT